MYPFFTAKLMRFHVCSLASLPSTLLIAPQETTFKVDLVSLEKHLTRQNTLTDASDPHIWLVPVVASTCPPGIQPQPWNLWNFLKRPF